MSASSAAPKKTTSGLTAVGKVGELRTRSEGREEHWLVLEGHTADFDVGEVGAGRDAGDHLREA
jgi:mannose-6-phosphate isomerase-like protein (cupin superfamily)